MKLNAIAWGAGLAFVAVAAGAFGTHALRDRVTPDRLAVWQTAVQYHLIHAVALVLIGVLALVRPHPRLKTVSVLFLLGIAIFGGSLYALVLTNVRILGAITPLGGVSFIAGWIVLAFTATGFGPDSDSDHHVGI